MKTRHIAIAVAVAVMASGCSQHREIELTTTPSPCIVTPTADNLADIDVTLHLSEKSVSDNYRLIILPQVMVGDTVYSQLHPVVLDGSGYDKKLNRKKVLSKYKDPYADYAVKAQKGQSTYDFPYRELVALPETAVAGRIVGVVTTDGCAECTAIDTIPIAYITKLATLVKLDPRYSMMEREFRIEPKERNGKAEARLQFIINKSDIEIDLANNRREMQNMIDSLTPVLRDTLSSLNAMSVYGTASVDGPYKGNIKLAQDRAESAVDWLTTQFRLTPRQKRLIKVGAHPEGWEPVIQAMIAANDPDSATVRRIVREYPEPTGDEAEVHIRKLECWPRISENYLDKDRKVQFEYSWTVRSFTTDKELLDMYELRPDAFNETEFLRVAQITEDPEEQKEVLRTTLRYFPSSEVASNNLACIYLSEGNADAVINMLKGRKNLQPELRNCLAAAYIMKGDLETASSYAKGIDSGEARYNLGLAYAKTNRYDKAWPLLAPFADTNAAIIALCIDKNEEAARILDNIESKTPLSHYARAIAAARLGDNETALYSLARAVRDQSLKERAAFEPDFNVLSSDPRFKSLIR